MSANTTLQITELDFDSIKNNLKTFLRSQQQFQDYDFEGSGMSVLLDILAYNTHYMGYYVNMVGNEMFLDTAQLRSSVLSHAKAINYVPQSRHGAKTQVNITVTPTNSENTTTTMLTLDRYTRLLGESIDGTNYPFVTVSSNTVTKSGNSFYFANVDIIQGEVVTRQFLMDPTNTKARFTIPSANVDTETLVVSVQESSTNTYTTVYSLSEDLTEATPNSTIYFVEENPDETYTILFGDNVIGKRPKNGNIIICTYLDTQGMAANKTNNFVVVESINGFRNNVRTTSIAAAYGGSEKETIEEARFRAPYAYTTQNRAVTVQDYSTLMLKDYPNIESISVWGGEDNDPPKYGKVYMSIKTKDDYALSDNEKEYIKNDLVLKRNVLTIIPEIVDPEYVYITIRGNVYYNPKLTTRDSNEILTFIRSAALDYAAMDLNKFTSGFNKSKLQQYIENSEESIIGCDLEIYLQKRVELTPGIVKNYTYRFGAPLRIGDIINNKLNSYPPIQTLDLLGQTRSVFIEEFPESYTGVEKIVITNFGQNYITAPKVTITGDGTGATAVAEIINGQVRNIVVTNKGSNYTRATVNITGGGGELARATAVTQAQTGTLRTYYALTNGQKIIVNNDAGSINYTSGEVLLKNLNAISVQENDRYELNVLTLSAPAENDMIFPRRNNIFTIDENDGAAISINLIARAQ